MSASSRSLATVAITALLGPGALAAAAPGPATARFGAGDLAKIVGFSSPQLSPDGTRVAVVVTRIDENADEYVRDLDLVDVRTHARRTLVAKRKGLADPAWSSSGDRLAFIADEGAGDDAHAQVFVLPMDGGDSRAVTHAPEGVEQFAWRPDGNALAYAAEDAKPKLAGAANFYDSYEVGNTPITGHAAERPAHLWTLDLASGAPARQHTFGPRSVATGEARSSLSWSPDGRELAYLDAPNNVLNDATDAHVAMLDVATGRVRSASGDAGFDGDPQFSPDGTKLAYVHSLGDSQIAVARVYVTPVAGAPRGVPVTATAPFDLAVHDYAWTPDGSAIRYACDDGTAVSVIDSPLAGASPRRLDLGGLAPTSPLAGAIGRDGSLAFVGTSNAQPSELFYRAAPQVTRAGAASEPVTTASASGSAPVRLTNDNAAVTGLALGGSETVRFTAENGMPSDAVLMTPPGFDPHKTYPLALEIHGGPTSASTQTFDRLGQLMTAHGWLVLKPNYRGSDNHGLAFQRAVRYDPEEGPAADIMAALAAVEARGIVDRKRVAVSGWSYGGVMTAWLATHANVWAAAVSGASVDDWAVDYSIADDSESDAALFHGTPWTSAENRLEYARQSAVTYAKNVTAPMLLLSDTGDNRDPIATTYEFFHALRDDGKDVTFVAWPVAGHFPRDPVRTRDVYEHWVDFIARHF